MNRFFLLIVWITFCFTSTVQAEPLACLDQQRCPDGSEPPFCCDKPPCEYKEQIRLKKAMRRVFSDKNVRARFKKEAGGDNPKAARKLYDYAVKKSKELGKTIQCKWDFNKFPPTFEVVDCSIVAKMPKGDQIMTKEQALNKIETCTEFIEAIYVHEGFHQEKCDPEKQSKQGIEAYALEERRGYTREINYLEAQALASFKACSADQKKKAEKDKREKEDEKLLEAGLKALMKNAKNKSTGKRK